MDLISAMCISSIDDSFISLFIGFKIMFLARLEAAGCIVIQRRLITQFKNIILKPIVKITSILMLNIACMLLFHTFSFAFFTAESTGQSQTTVTTKNDAWQSSFSHYLVWTDSDEFHLQIYSANSDSAHASGHYFFAFYIPIIEMLTQQRETYVPTEFSVENLLYANLKLERLLSEYNSLKERSQSILEGLDVPYISQSSEYEHSSKKEQIPISETINEIANHINILAGPILTGHGATDTIRNSNFQHQQPSRRIEPLNKLKEPLNYSTDTALARSQPFRNRSGSPHGTGTGSNASEENDQPGSMQDDYIPSVERLTRSLIGYFKNNKAEFVIYILLLVGFYHLLFRVRKR